MDLHRCSAAGPRAHRKTNEVWGRGSCTRPVEVNHGPLMTSGLVRLIGGCTLYRLGRPRISSVRFPHPRYRIIFIGGRNRGAEI
jgi:hypothetical protein